jgi:hypothetical protein
MISNHVSEVSSGYLRPQYGMKLNWNLFAFWISYSVLLPAMRRNGSLNKHHPSSASQLHVSHFLRVLKIFSVTASWNDESISTVTQHKSLFCVARKHSLNTSAVWRFRHIASLIRHPYVEIANRPTKTISVEQSRCCEAGSTTSVSTTHFS